MAAANQRTQVGIAGNADIYPYAKVCEWRMVRQAKEMSTCTQNNRSRHGGMCVDGNGNRRKPGSEASVGCNEVKTWGSSGACQQAVQGTPTPGGRIL